MKRPCSVANRKLPPAPLRHVERGERVGGRFEIDADRLGGEQHGQRIEREMVTGAPSRYDDGAAVDFAHSTTVCVFSELHIDQPRIGRPIGAESRNMTRRRAARRGGETAKLIIVAIEDGDAARNQTGEDLGLRVGDGLDACEEFEMDRRDSR